MTEKFLSGGSSEVEYTTMVHQLLPTRLHIHLLTDPLTSLTNRYGRYPHPPPPNIPTVEVENVWSRNGRDTVDQEFPTRSRQIEKDPLR